MAWALLYIRLGVVTSATDDLDAGGTHDEGHGDDGDCRGVGSRRGHDLSALFVTFWSAMPFSMRVLLSSWDFLTATV